MWRRSLSYTALIAAVLVSLSAFADTPISWSQPGVKSSVLQGTLRSIVVSFEATHDLNAVDVSIVPALQQFVAVNPAHFDHVAGGQAYQIKLLFSVSEDAIPGQYEGALQLRSSTTPTKVFALPLPILLTVVPLSTDVIPASIGLPSLDRIRIDDGVKYAANEIIACVRPDTIVDDVPILAASVGASFIGQDSSFGCYQLHVSFAGLHGAVTLMQRLEANTFVRYALPALFSDAQSSELIPDDASWLPVNKETQSWAQQAIRLPAAWNLTYAPNADRTKTAGIKLAIVDDGYTPHEDIIFAAESTNPGFSSTHGTPVSSLASATGNNGKGLAGAMWESHLMLMGSYYADTQFDIHARNNMLQALQNGARIINYSYAGDWSSLCNPDRDPVDLQIILPQEKIFWRDVVSVAPLNVLFIFAAGNFRDTGDATVPAILSEEFPNVISVAGSDRLGNQASYSNYGPVSVWAPGGDKPTDLQCAGRTSDAYIQDPLAQQANVAAQLYAALPVNTYGYVTGTSEAAPLLAGVGGLMLAQNAGLTGSQLREIIVTTADHTGRVDPSDREITILNACRAVRTATGFPTNFALASSNPASGSANVPLSQSIFLSFNIPIDQNNPSSLLQVVASTGDRVSGTILVLNDESIEFIPSSQLLPGVSYLVDLRAITDKYCGDRLSGSTSVTFTTTAQVTTPPPPNDNFAAAITIPSIPFAASVDITSATTEAGEPLDCAIGDHVLGNTVWYKFTPGVATSLLATLTSSESANGFCIVAYSGSSLVSLQRLGAAGANGHAQLGFPIPFNPNITYYIQVGGIRGTTGLVSFEFTLMPPAPGNALDDNFNANVLDSNRWTSTISGPGTITVTNQRVEMAQTNLGSVYTGLATSSCWITGDFDVQVDYNLLAWPAQNFHTVRLVTDLPEGQTGAVGVYRSSYADEEYQFRSVNPVVAVSTSDMSGRLRVTRKGTIVAGYYFNGIQFVQIGSAATNNNATGFTIDFSGPSSPLAGIAFDNFKVSADAVYCPSTLIAPASLPGLVAFYPFEGNANDGSSNGNNGAVVGGVSFVTGKIGQAAAFDGSTGYISVSDSPSLRLNTFTLAAWVNPSVIEGGNRVMEKGNSDSYYLDVNSDGKALVGIFDGVFHNLIAPVALQTNTWYFVAGTYDGTSLRLYVNGTLVNSLVVVSSPFQTSEPLILGWKFNGIPSDHFAGLIDEARIYNRALSLAEIQELYNLP